MPIKLIKLLIVLGLGLAFFACRTTPLQPLPEPITANDTGGGWRNY